ncbi:MAG: hypothetical protein JWL61_5241 [Gemmatimonadetes bacterium]|nr:hypothetical protein [Gemmatimonadota bacterium]
MEVALYDTNRCLELPDFMLALRSTRPARRVLTLVASIVFASACSDTTAPLQLEGRPTILEFSIGGFGAPSRQLELRGDTVIARRRPFNWTSTSPTDSVRVIPSAEQWRAFWSAADAAGVQQWHVQYNAEGIVDGEGWSLSVASRDRAISSWGSNAYPDRNGREHETQRPAEFEAFLNALNVLAGVSGWF